MTAPVIETAGGSFAFDPAPVARPGYRHRVILRARLVDEQTGLPVDRVTMVGSSVSGLTSRIGPGGLVGLAGNPGRCLTDLAANPADLPFAIEARGYLPQDVQATIGPFNTGLGFPGDFPEIFEPVDLGTIALHRQPVVISGRVMLEIGSDRLALAGVAVTLTGIWRTEPGPEDDPGLLVEAADVVAVAPGLYRERLAGASVRQVPVALAGDAKRLIEPVRAGSLHAHLSDSVSLAVGDLLAIDIQRPERTETIHITAIQPGLAPTDPARVQLAYPPRMAHAVGTACDAATVGPPVGPGRALVRNGIAGDRTVHLDGLPALPPGGAFIEISGVGDPEYARAELYTATTSPEGDWRFPPISRAARLRIAADRPDFPSALVTELGPAFGVTTQQLDFVRRP